MTIPIPGLNLLSDDAIFYICVGASLVSWFVLIFAPKSDMRPTVVKIIVLIQCVFYVPTFALSLTEGEGSIMSTFAGFTSLGGVIKAFSDTAVVLPAWLHFLGFDLVVANYLVEQNIAAPAGLPQALMGLVLVLISLAGPAGFLLYTILAAVYPLVGPKGTTKAA